MIFSKNLLTFGTQKLGDKMSPRTGRPLKGKERLDIDVKVRFDNELNEKLVAYCELRGITRTEAIRQGVHLLLAAEKEENGSVNPSK